MLDVVAAGASAAVEPLAAFHAQADDAHRVRSGNLIPVHLAELALVVADDASAVVSHLQVSVFLVDESPHRSAKLLLLRQEPHLFYHASTLCVLHGHHARLPVDGQ